MQTSTDVTRQAHDRPKFSDLSADDTRAAFSARLRLNALRAQHDADNVREDFPRFHTGK